MFCSNCGKQIADGSKFCRYCGASSAVQEGQGKQISSGNLYNQNTNNGSYSNVQLNMDQQTIWLIAMTALTVFIALGFLWSIVEVSFYSGAKFGFLDVNNITKFMKATDLGGFWIFLIWVATIASGISVLLCAVFLKELYNGQRGEDLTGVVKNTSICQLVAMGIVVFLTFCVNMQAKDLGGITIFKITVMGWFLIIACLANLFFVINRYEEECYDYAAKNGTSSGYGNSGVVRICMRCETNYTFGRKCPKCGSTEAREKGTIDKVCMICKTSYSLGNKCPKCGSKSTQ